MGPDHATVAAVRFSEIRPLAWPARSCAKPTNDGTRYPMRVRTTNRWQRRGDDGGNGNDKGGDRRRCLIFRGGGEGKILVLDDEEEEMNDDDDHDDDGRTKRLVGLLIGKGGVDILRIGMIRFF